jgi:hypothetical protein
MWRHKKLAGTRILVVDTWCQLDGSGTMVDPDPIPDRIHKALSGHPDWKPIGAGSPKPAAAAPDTTDGAERQLPKEVSVLSSVKKLRELARRLDIDLGDATRRADVEAAIAASDRTDTQLVAVAKAIAQE